MGQLKMDPVIRALWVAKLREDRPQTTGALMRVTPYESGYGFDSKPAGQCCLGVLCEIAIEQGLPLEAELIEENGTVQFTALTPNGVDDSSSGTLPEAVAEWAGLKYQDPYGDDEPYAITDPMIGGREASSWNDTLHKSFAEIADLIEEFL